MPLFVFIDVSTKAGWINVGDLASAVHFKIVKYERIKFLVIALRDGQVDTNRTFV